MRAAVCGLSGGRRRPARERDRDGSSIRSTQVARHRQHADAAGPQRAGVRAQCSRADQILQGLHADHAVLAQHGVDDPVVADQGAGMRLRRPGCELAGARLQDHQGLAELGGPARGGAEHRGLADRLGEDPDRAGVLVVDEIVHDVRDGHHRLVACRDHEAEPHVLPSGIADHGRAYGPALRDQREAARYDRHVQAQRARSDAVPQVGEP